MRALAFGDVVGLRAVDELAKRLPELIKRMRVDFVMVNVENAARGFGVTGEICETLEDAGADVLTTGNHVWDNSDIYKRLATDARLLRPVNLPGAPGRGFTVLTARDGSRVLTINPIGRLFMPFPSDNPFLAVEALLSEWPMPEKVDAILIDMHAESNGEKDVMGAMCDGRVSAVVGTHCHTPTADARVCSGGSAYITDLGMCGDYDSVIGMERASFMRRMIEQLPSGRSRASDGAPTLCGALIETDDATGLAKAIAPVRLGGMLASALPDF